MTGYAYYLVTLVRLLLLAVSLYGYLRYLEKKVRIEFAVGILLSGIGSILFMAGIIHILREMAWLVFAIGLCLAAQSVRSEKNQKCPPPPEHLYAGRGLLLHSRGILPYSAL